MFIAVLHMVEGNEMTLNFTVMSFHATFPAMMQRVPRVTRAAFIAIRFSRRRTKSETHSPFISCCRHRQQLDEVLLMCAAKPIMNFEWL